jgi:hypothetical protein
MWVVGVVGNLSLCTKAIKLGDIVDDVSFSLFYHIKLDQCQCGWIRGLICGEECLFVFIPYWPSVDYVGFFLSDGSGFWAMLPFVFHERVCESDLGSIILEFLWFCKEIHFTLVNEVLCFVWVSCEFVQSFDIFLFIHVS